MPHRNLAVHHLVTKKELRISILFFLRHFVANTAAPAVWAARTLSCSLDLTGGLHEPILRFVRAHSPFSMSAVQRSGFIGGCHQRKESRRNRRPLFRPALFVRLARNAARSFRQK